MDHVDLSMFVYQMVNLGYLQRQNRRTPRHEDFLLAIEATAKTWRRTVERAHDVQYKFTVKNRYWHPCISIFLAVHCALNQLIWKDKIYSVDSQSRISWSRAIWLFHSLSSYFTKEFSGHLWWSFPEISDVSCHQVQHHGWGFTSWPWTRDFGSLSWHLRLLDMNIDELCLPPLNMKKIGGWTATEINRTALTYGGFQVLSFFQTERRTTIQKNGGLYLSRF